MGKGNKQIENGELKIENGKEEKGRMDMPIVPPPSLEEKEEPERIKAGKHDPPKRKPPRRKPAKKKDKKSRPRKFDFSMNGKVSSRQCPYCLLWYTERISTKDNIQYRKCNNQSCAGNPRDGNKKTYKVVGVQV